MIVYNDISDVDLPILEDQLYIYVLENSPQGNIKIGRTTNIKQRLHSLSGSNSGGNHISRIAVSKPTYLYSLETTAHTHYHRYRIDGTEWFDGKYVTFDEVVNYINSLFDQKGYNLCNETRRKFNEERNIKYNERSIND